MRILITIMLLWSSAIAFSQEIWQLSPWAPDSSYVIGAYPSGEPKWVKVDSLGVADSIYLAGDNVKLRDGAGVAQLPTASTSTKGLLTSTDWNTFNSKVGGSGVATRVAFWNGSSSLSSNSNLFWDNEYNSLGIGGYPSPASKLHLIGGDLFIIGGDNRRFLLGNNTSGNGFGGMKWSTANEMHYIHSGYNENTGVMLTNSLGYTGLRTRGVTPTTPLDIFSSTDIDGGTYQKWALGSAPNTYNLHLKQTYTSGNIRYNFSQVNGGTAYDNVLVFDRGKIALNHLDAVRQLDINGEVRIRDLVTDTPTRIVGADADGDLGEITLGTGLSWSGNTLNGNVGNVTGSGVATRVAFWNGTNSLSSNSSLFWDNEYNSLGIGGYPSPASKLHLIGGDLFIIGGDNRRFLLGNNTSGNGFGGMKWSTANEMHYIHSGYNENTGVMLTNSLGYTGLRTRGVTPTTPLDIFSSTDIDGGTYQKWALGSAPNTYNLHLKQTYTSGNIRYNFSQVNGGTAYDNVLVFDRGKIALNHLDAVRQLDINGEVRIRDLVTDTPTRIVGADADGDLGEIVLGTGLSFTGNTLNATGDSGSTEYLDPYIVSSDTVGFILKNVQDTVQFIGVAGVTGESTTVSDSPTINMTLTGTNISSEVIDGSITPAKLSQTYLTSEVDGSTTNEIQTLSISGSNLSISGAGGNTVTLPSGGGSSEWASLHYGSLAANTQTLTSSVWNTINFTGSSESNASVLDANHTNDEIEFVSAGTYRVDYRVSFIANADALIYSGIYSSASSSVDSNTQMESDTDSGYKHTIMQHSYIKTAVAGEKIKLQVQPLIAHTSVAIYSNFIVTKL